MQEDNTRKYVLAFLGICFLIGGVYGFFRTDQTDYPLLNAIWGGCGCAILPVLYAGGLYIRGKW